MRMATASVSSDVAADLRRAAAVDPEGVKAGLEEGIMFKRLFGRRSDETDLHMPEVDELPNIEERFENGPKAAAGEGEQAPEQPGQHVIVVTPGRMLMFQPCPPPGSMPSSQVASIQQMISPKVKRNVAAIAYTELSALTSGISKAVPFFGFLLGFAYIGHAVWVFEGHPSALTAGCRGADVLIVDGGMVPHLQKDWAATASDVMRKAEIYVHDRATYSLRKVA